jgi:hypothetical protein
MENLEVTSTKLETPSHARLLGELEARRRLKKAPYERGGQDQEERDIEE